MMNDSSAPLTKWSSAFLAVVLLATCVRCVEFVRSDYGKNPLARGLGEEGLVAQALADGQGFVTPYHPPGKYVKDPSAMDSPGFPFLLAGIIRLCRAFAGSELLPYRITVGVNILL